MSNVARPISDVRHEAHAKATAAVSGLEHSVTELANEPTVGHFYVREHVRQSLPAVVQTRNTLQNITSEAQDGAYAARGGLELASMLNRSLSQPVLDKLKQALAEAAAAAKAIQQQQAAAAAEAAGSPAKPRGAVAGARDAVAGASAALRRVWSKRSD